MEYKERRWESSWKRKQVKKEKPEEIKELRSFGKASRLDRK